MPKLPLAICLTIKMVRDPSAWNPARLRELKHENLPDLEPIPEFLENQYRRWRPHDKVHFFTPAVLLGDHDVSNNSPVR